MNNIDFARKIMSPQLGLYILIGFLPFVTNEIFLGLCIISIFMFVVNRAISEKTPIVFTETDLPILFFALIQIISTITSVTPVLSFQNLIVSLIGILIYFVITNTVKDLKSIDKILKLFLIIAFLLSCYGIIQYFTLGTTSKAWVDIKMNPDLKTRVVGTFDNPNIFAEYIEHILIPALALAFVCRKSMNKIITFFMTFVVFICLILTFSRAAWLGTIAGLGILILFKYAKLIPIFIGGAICSIPFLPSVIVQRIMSINLQDSSNAYRMNIWEGTINMIRDFWITGIGYGYWAFKNTFIEYSIKGTRAWHSHNLYLELLAEMGIFGLIVFAWIIILTLKKSMELSKKIDNEYLGYISIGLACALISLLIHGFAEHILYMPKSVILFWILLGFIMSTVNISKTEKAVK